MAERLLYLSRADVEASGPGMPEIISALETMFLEKAARRFEMPPKPQELLAYLRHVPGVVDASAAGSLRRMRATVGDLDILVAAPNSQAVMVAFTGHPDVIRVSGQGETKASVEFSHNLRAQLWVHPPERFGTALQYATGSKDHNGRLRELALKQGLSLSDQAFLRPDGSEILCATEEEVYATLGLPWIPPELREDRGEVQAAQAGTLPDLVALPDIRAELHCHSNWSDGKLTIQGMTLPLRLDAFQGEHVGRPCRLGLEVTADRRILVSGRVSEIARGAVTLATPQ